MSNRTPRSAAAVTRRARRVNVPTAGFTGAVGVGGVALAHAPWWATVAMSILGLATTALAAVFPQESADRLSLWQNWIKHRERLQARRHAQRHERVERAALQAATGPDAGRASTLSATRESWFWHGFRELAPAIEVAAG
jgi:hypothetical protein